MKELLFSGVKPTNVPHIGNYIGALKQWVELQRQHRSLFCIVDLHAITVPQDSKQLRENTLDIAATYLAIGLDPKRCTMFIQSEVHEHAELGWILGTTVKMSELERMTQYKDKARVKKKMSEWVCSHIRYSWLRIFCFTTLPWCRSEKIRCNTLNWHALSRDVLMRNSERHSPCHGLLIQKVGARVMSLDNPKTKMSKSGSAASYISLTDDADTIRKKIMRAVTDSGQSVAFDPEKRPAISNLLTIFHHATGRHIKDVEAEFASKGYGEFKTALAEAVIAMLAPIQAKLNEYRKDPTELRKILDAGRDAASKLAGEKMKIVRELVGLGR